MSRLTSEKCMPSWPIEMPSDTEMVPNSSGYPPAACTPALTAFASRSSDRLHGVISFHELATPICGLAKSSSPMPTARSIPRAAVASSPSVTCRERGLMSMPGASRACSSCGDDSSAAPRPPPLHATPSRAVRTGPRGRWQDARVMTHLLPAAAPAGSPCRCWSRPCWPGAARTGRRPADRRTDDRTTTGERRRRTCSIDDGRAAFASGDEGPEDSFRTWLAGGAAARWRASVATSPSRPPPVAGS